MLNHKRWFDLLTLPLDLHWAPLCLPTYPPMVPHIHTPLQPLYTGPPTLPLLCRMAYRTFASELNVLCFPEHALLCP